MFQFMIKLSYRAKHRVSPEFIFNSYPYFRMSGLLMRRSQRTVPSLYLILPRKENEAGQNLD